MKCPELSRLPKASQLSSVLFRDQTPGLLLKTGIFADPTHPVVEKKEYWPQFRTSAFSIQAVPFASLQRPLCGSEPFIPRIDTWEERVRRGCKEGQDSVAPHIIFNGRAHRIPMSFLPILPMKDTHKSSVIRSKITKRLKTAVTLIVVRGAKGVERDGKMQLQLNGKDSVHNLILRGWTYVFRPNLEVYRMPYPHLVSSIRKGLYFIHQEVSELERQWEEEYRHAVSQSNVKEKLERKWHAAKEQMKKIRHAKINAEERILADLNREIARFDPWKTLDFADMDMNMDMDTTNTRELEELKKLTQPYQVTPLDLARRKMLEARPVVKPRGKRVH